MKENKNAIAIVKQMVADGQISQDVAEKYFPELKESEDEKIRKEIIDCITTIREHNNFPYYKEQFDNWDESKCESWISWLEKQGEQEFNCDKLETFVKGWRDKYSYPDDIDKFIGFAKSVIKWYQQNEQKPFDYEKAHIQQNEFVPKSALEAINGEKVDNQNCIKSDDKVEPKFHEGEWLCENEPNLAVAFKKKETKETILIHDCTKRG